MHIGSVCLEGGLVGRQVATLVALDSTDAVVLSVLHNDGQTTVADLAVWVSMSAGRVTQRVCRHESQGPSSAIQQSSSRRRSAIGVSPSRARTTAVPGIRPRKSWTSIPAPAA